MAKHQRKANKPIKNNKEDKEVDAEKPTLEENKDDGLNKSPCKSSSQNQDVNSNEYSKTTLFVRNIPLEATKEQFEAFFSEIGPIRSCFLVSDHALSSDKKDDCEDGSLSVEQDIQKLVEDYHENQEEYQQIRQQRLNKHRGIGFVQYAIAEDAERARTELKSEKFFETNKKLKMEFAVKKSLVKQGLNKSSKSSSNLAQKSQNSSNKVFDKIVKQNKSIKETSSFVVKKGKVIVRNLPFRCNEKILKATFAPFGKVMNVSIPLKPDGKMRGFGFVEFEETNCAEKAIEKLNGTEIMGRQVAIDWAVPKDTYEAIVAAEETLNKTGASDILQTEIDSNVQNIEQEENQDVSDPDCDQDVMSNEEIDENESTEDIIDDEKDLQIEVTVKEDNADIEETNKKLKSRNSNLSISVDEGTTLFIRNLSYDSTEEDLSEKFSSFGKLRYARITKDKGSGLSKGTGFVSFFNQEDAQKCLDEFQSAQEDPLLNLEQEETKRQQHQNEKSKTVIKSMLQPEPSLTASSASFVLNGRFLQVSVAVKKQDAEKLKQEGIVKRKESDKRNLYLIKEGVVFPDSNEAQGMKPSELSKRQQSYATRKQLLAKNPNLFISKTRLSVRNLGPKITESELRQAAVKAIKQFWYQVSKKERSSLDQDVMEEETKLGLPLPSFKRRVLFKQVKIMRDKERIDAETKKGKSKGFGFIEFESHADALICLRVMNNNPHAFDFLKQPTTDSKVENGSVEESKKQENVNRPIVEFSVENQLILKKRDERMKMNRESKGKSSLNIDSERASQSTKNKSKSNKKRSASEVQEEEEGLGKGEKVNNKNKKKKSETKSESQKAKLNQGENKKLPASGKAKTHKIEKKSETKSSKRSLAAIQKDVPESQKEKKNKRLKRNGEKQDDLDKLIQQRKQSLFGGSPANDAEKDGHKHALTTASIQRWYN